MLYGVDLHLGIQCMQYNGALDMAGFGASQAPMTMSCGSLLAACCTPVPHRVLEAHCLKVGLLPCAK